MALYSPNITVNQGVQVAGLILRNVIENTNPSITLSSGVSSWDHSRDESVGDLFIRADKALHEAKKSGKHSVVKKRKCRNLDWNRNPVFTSDMNTGTSVF
ncbi:hypothetical protein GCM10028868_06860 [Virgibacillus kimchii]